MAGQAKKLIDKLVALRSKGDDTLIQTTVTKLILKGIDPNRFTAVMEDDPVVLAKIAAAAKDFGIALN